MDSQAMLSAACHHELLQLQSQVRLWSDYHVCYVLRLHEISL